MSTEIFNVYEVFFCWDTDDISTKNIAYTEIFEKCETVSRIQASIKDISDTFHNYIGKRKVIRVLVTGKNFVECGDNALLVLEKYINMLPPSPKKNILKSKESLIDSILGGIKNVTHKRKT